MGGTPIRLEGFQPSRTVDNGQHLPTGTSATGEDARGTHGRDAHATFYRLIAYKNKFNANFFASSFT